jgi:hypothetical protein
VLFATSSGHRFEGGHDIRTVQELLGHRDVSTTMTYLHVLKRGRSGGEESGGSSLGGGPFGVVTCATPAGNRARVACCFPRQLQIVQRLPGAGESRRGPRTPARGRSQPPRRSRQKPLGYLQTSQVSRAPACGIRCYHSVNAWLAVAFPAPTSVVTCTYLTGARERGDNRLPS